jgi:arginyl-tRNA--protein-N-Asp/Glu arginylyltransferase
LIAELSCLNAKIMNHSDDAIKQTDEIVSKLESLEFFQTQNHKCSYLPEQQASTVFLNPNQRIDNTLYSQLAELGFRRSGCHVYKPMCRNCQACIPVRIPVNDFRINRQQRRTKKYNQSLVVRPVDTIDTDEHYTLYQRYINERHVDGDMYPASLDQFQSFLSGKWLSTKYFEFRDEGRLVASSVADVMDNGISAVYTYYDPEITQRSLGIYAILHLIEQARQQQLASVYLGYWIEESPKMRYKSVFKPLEFFSEGKWLRIDKPIRSKSQ